MDRKTFLRLAATYTGGLAALPFVGPLDAAAPDAASFPGRLSRAAAQGDDAFWRVVRAEFVLDPDWTFLNCGGLGACPLPVLNSLFEGIRTEERAPNAAHDGKRWDLVKEQLAGVLGKGCRKEDLALVSTATEGVNLIVNGLPLQRGDEVITSTHEHAAVYTSLFNRKQRDGIVVRTFAPDTARGLGNVDRIASLVNDRTRLVIISHVTCTTGQLFPVKEIAALARAKKIWFALDGAQAPVCTQFDIAECGADFYACSAHKWLLAPKRTGFLYVRPGMVDVLRPLVVGMGSYERFDVEKGEVALHPGARRFEFGTQNEALFFALGTAVSFVESIGLDRVCQHNRTLAERFRDGLGEIPGVELVSPEEHAYRTPMIGFRMRGQTYRQIQEHLAADRIRVRSVTEGGLNSIRVSFHVCNNDDDVTAILQSLRKLKSSS
jgi:selenocysteine lyase/cysteine desulfurase